MVSSFPFAGQARTLGAPSPRAEGRFASAAAVPFSHRDESWTEPRAHPLIG